MTRRGSEDEEILFGVHPVTEAIEAGRRSIDRVLVAREGGSRSLGRLLRAARDKAVPVTYLPRNVLARKIGARAAHQGVAAVVSAAAYADPEAVVARASSDPQGLLVVLDGVEDPRNLGAILRTAAAAGVTGVLLGVEEAVGLSPAVAKTSAGAIEIVPVARERHLRKRLADLGETGFRVVALDPRSSVGWDTECYTGKVVLVAGGESKGVRRGILEVTHSRVALPLRPGVESLNVSVAVGAVLFEVVRQRRSGGKAAGR